MHAPWGEGRLHQWEGKGAPFPGTGKALGGKKGGTKYETWKPRGKRKMKQKWCPRQEGTPEAPKAWGKTNPSAHNVEEETSAEDQGLGNLDLWGWETHKPLEEVADFSPFFFGGPLVEIQRAPQYAPKDYLGTPSDQRRACSRRGPASRVPPGLPMISRVLVTLAPLAYAVLGFPCITGPLQSGYRLASGGSVAAILLAERRAAPRLRLRPAPHVRLRR